MAKIVIVTSELHGGSATWIVQLLEILASAGHDVVIAYFPNGNDQEQHVPDAVRHVRLESGFKSFKGLLRNTAALRRLFRDAAPDIIYTNTVFPLLSVATLVAMRLLPPRTKIVHALHSLFRDHFRRDLPRALAACIERMASMQVDKVIAPSRYMYRQGEKYYGASKVVLIRNCLSESKQVQLRAVREARTRRPAGSPREILFVGRADRQKGLDLLVKAFAIVRRQCDSTLSIVGVSDKELARLTGNSLAQTPGIRCHGWLTDTTSAYRTADVFVIPSRWEAFGLTLLEARMAGLPCVGTKVDAIPELIPAEAGVVTNTEDVEALAQGLRQVLGSAETYASIPVDDLPTHEEHRKHQIELVRALAS